MYQISITSCLNQRMLHFSSQAFYHQVLFKLLAVWSISEKVQYFRWSLALLAQSSLKMVVAIESKLFYSNLEEQVAVKVFWKVSLSFDFLHKFKKLNSIVLII